MIGDPSPGYRPAEAACSLGSRQDLPGPAAEAEDLRSRPGEEGLRRIAVLAEADLGVHPVRSS